MNLAKYCKLYLNNGLKVIPTEGKKPLLSYKETDYRKIINISQKASGLSFIPSFSNLVVLDFDNREEFEEYVKLYPSYLFVKTIKGGHCYFRNNNIVKKSFRITETIEVKYNSFIVLPPSKVKSHIYTFFIPNKQRNISIKEFLEYIPNLPLISIEILKKLSSRQNIEYQPKYTNNLEEVIELVKRNYRQGVRNHLIFYLSGFLRKSNVDLEKAKSIIKKIAIENKDEELNTRLIVCERTYKIDIQKVKGISGIFEIIKNV
ncbi:MAG: bifunctional DNA primase/polymerase [Endomicrobia bacterium]|nr:bifunctional DNA primase/polymerase [Endomicrobiia bacterium]